MRIPLRHRLMQDHIAVPHGHGLDGQTVAGSSHDHADRYPTQTPRQYRTATVTHEMGHPHRTIGTGLLLALPCGVVVLNLIVWIVGVSRSGFWADDFLNVTQYARTLGNLSNYHINTGKYIGNIFWALGTEAFGNGSVVPFLLLNSLVFAAGVITWLWVGSNKRWSAVDSWWIGGLFLATAAWLPTALWSSNIVHSGGFLALGVGLFAHERAMSMRTARGCAGWSALTGAAWTFAVVSDLLYIGLMVIAVYCAWYQIGRLRGFGMKTPGVAVFVGFWNLLLPIFYFVAVAYPGTTSSTAYAVNGPQFVHENLRFYKLLLAPTDLLTAVYAVLLVGGVIGALAALRRRDPFPFALLGAAGATALPALVQSQQRDIHYMAMPLLLLFSALAAGVRPVLLGKSKRLAGTILLATAVTLLLLFRQGADIRAFFVQTPYGSNLATFRSEVASLTPEGGVICTKLDLDAPHQSLFIAEMSGENGFLVPPINATQVYFAASATPCPVSAVTHITVSLNARGNFVASG